MSNHTETITIPFDLASDYGRADSLIPAGARAAYEAAAEELGVEILWAGEGTPEGDDAIREARAALAGDDPDDNGSEAVINLAQAIRDHTPGIVASGSMVARALSELAVDGTVTAEQVRAALVAADADLDEGENLRSVDDRLFDLGIEVEQ